MAKTRPSRKSVRKTAPKAKPRKARPAKARPAKPSGGAAKARKAAIAVKAPVKAPKPRRIAPVVEIPEIPPPLPAPIASFTF
jgi:hypothetical protein